MIKKILMILFILILSSMLTTLLVVVDYFTAPIIQRNMELKFKESVLRALDIPFSEDEIEEIFIENISEKVKNEDTYYVSKKGEIAILFSGPGLWGPIDGILALYSDLKTIKGVTIIRQEETPGLGSRITEKEYLDSFKNKEFSPLLKIKKSGEEKAGNEIDSITGATMTSDAFIEILNNRFEEYLSIVQGD